MTRKQLLQTPFFLLTFGIGAIIGLCVYLLIFIPLMINPRIIDAPKEFLIAKVSREFMRAMMRRNTNAKVVA